MAHRIYHHVAVVGADGAGQFFRDANTPCFDEIFRNGAVTYRAYSSKPSISAECWGSMLTGVSPKVHGMTNGSICANPYPSDSPYPSLFRRIHAAYPDYVQGAFCEFGAIVTGIVERDLPVTGVPGQPDHELVPQIVDYVKKEKPNFLFVQCDSTDYAGHHNGYGTEAHLAQISLVDSYMGRIYDAYREAGLLEDTLFIAIADHGGTNEPSHCGGHGGWADREKLVTFACAGASVLPGEMGDANVRDLAAIVLYALGIDAPPFVTEGWTSQVPEYLFDEDDVPPYRDISSETCAEPRISRTPHASERI